jgi:hypothetical protein
MLTAPSTSLVNWFSLVLEGKYDATHVWWDNTQTVCIRTHGPKLTFRDSTSDLADYPGERFFICSATGPR